MTPPLFWRHGHTAPLLLRPLGWIYAGLTARRVAGAGWTAPVPVICCGNAGAGGAGKTPLALDLAARLLRRGCRPAFLTRGHGGSARGPLRVETGQSARQVGDEALLLAACAPTYVGSDRAATAAMAVGQGADVLVMDDGLQNPVLAKTMSLLVIDGGAGFGNAHVIPAGPLREPVAAAASRCAAAVLIGADTASSRGQLPPGLPVLAARIVPDAEDLASLPPDIVAFAGIGRPEKFFETLAAHGRRAVATIPFADHHPYRPADLARVHAMARARDAVPVTTQKDYVRLAEPLRAGILRLRIGLEWDDPTGIEDLLTQALTHA